MNGKMLLYKVDHLHIIYDDIEDLKFIGIFSTRENAEKAVEILSRQPGFKDFPKIITEDDIDNETNEGFYINEVVVDEIAGWKEGFATVRWTE